MPVLGGRERKVSQFGNRPRWSLTERRSVPESGFIRERDAFFSMTRVYAATLDGNAPYEVQAELLRDFVSVNSAIWHPDGQRISLLGESRRSGGGLTTVPLAGGTPVKSEPGDELKERDRLGTASDVRWAPSGRAVYFNGRSQASKASGKSPSIRRPCTGPRDPNV